MTITATTPGKTRPEPETVESLIRRAHANMASTNRTASPSRVTKVIRRYVRNYGITIASDLVEGLAAVELPTASEKLWYDIATINNQHLVMPDSFKAMPTLSGTKPYARKFQK